MARKKDEIVNPSQPNGTDFDIPAKKGQKPLRVKLAHPAQQKYDVWKKDIPTGLPTSFVDPDDGQTKPITWHNNFGLKLKGKDAFEEDVDSYEVEIEAAPESVVVYYHKNKVNKVKNPKFSNGKATFKLALGDPPIGSGTGG
jgi:hypothetical protein